MAGLIREVLTFSSPRCIFYPSASSVLCFSYHTAVFVYKCQCIRYYIIQFMSMTGLDCPVLSQCHVCSCFLFNSALVMELVGVAVNLYDWG